MAKERLGQRRTTHISLKLLCATIFVLTAAPRAGVKAGPVPIYIIDFLLLLTFYYSTQLRSVHKGRRPFVGFIAAIVLFVVMSELGAVAFSGRALEPLYILARTLLAVSLFFSASKIVRSEDDVIVIMKAGLLGLCITSLLMIMTSLPIARGLATHYIFSIRFLEPAAEGTVRQYADTVSVMRGRSLVGVSILSGAFLNTFWPFVFLLYQSQNTIGFWKRLARAGMWLAPIGVVMSYSRGAVLGLFLAIGGVLSFGSSKSRQGVIVASLLVFTLFSVVGWDSEYFFFERLENRTEAMINNPYEDAREYSRLLAYVEPITHLKNNPHFFFFGEGISITRHGDGEQAGKSTHAVFAKAYFAYGMLAALTYTLLVVSGVFYVLRQIRIRRRAMGFPLLFSQALFAGTLGMLPWLVFGHAAVSTPRGAMLFFLLFGLLASLQNFNVSSKATTRAANPTA